jgi:hypothetical protein
LYCPRRSITADCGHERRLYLASSECREHVAHAAIAHLFGTGAPLAIGAQGQHNGIDAIDGGA